MNTAYLESPNGTILNESATGLPETLTLEDEVNITAWATKEFDIPVDEDGWVVLIDVTGEDTPRRINCGHLEGQAADEYYEGREGKCLGDYLSRRVKRAADLGDLVDALNLKCPAENSYPEPCSCENAVDFTSLPTFGGVEPDDTTYPLWSWDAEHYLLDSGGTDKGWHLALRTEIDALRTEDKE